MRPARSFVGRQRELALLRQHYETAAGGQVCVVLVTGEPGIGKTSLLRETAVRAAQVGATVLWGDASEADGMPPYLPFLEALGAYIRTAPAHELRAQAGPGANILVTILPELADRLGELPRGYPLPAEQAQLRLYEAIGGLLAAIAASASPCRSAASSRQCGSTAGRPLRRAASPPNHPVKGRWTTGWRPSQQLGRHHGGLKLSTVIFLITLTAEALTTLAVVVSIALPQRRIWTPRQQHGWGQYAISAQKEMPGWNHRPNSGMSCSASMRTWERGT